MKKIAWIIIVTFLLPLHIYSQTIKEVLWYPPIPNAREGMAEVQVSGLTFRCYLGCTFLFLGADHDVGVKEISLVTGTKYIYKGIFPEDASEVIFSLWQKKITSNDYARLSTQERNKLNISQEEAMQRFKEIGYFMDGLIDSTGWLDLVDAYDNPIGSAFGIRIYPSE